MNEIEELRRIREIAESLLRDGCEIADIVYRPFDMGCFGGKGYSLVLYKAPDKAHGLRFNDSPSDEEIIKGVEMIQSMISPNAELSGPL